MAIGVFGALVAGASVHAGTSFAGPAQDHETPQAEYDQVTAEEQRLSSELTEIEARAKTLQTQLDELEADAAASQRALDAAREAQAAAERTAKIEADKAEAARLEAIRMNKLLGEQAVAAYVAGGDPTSMADAILRSQSSSDAESAVMYSKVVLGDTTDTVNRVEEAERIQKQASADAAAAEAEAAEQRDNADAANTLVVAARDQQAAVVTDINEQAALKTAKLQDIQAQKIVLETQITAMQHASDGVQELLAAVQANQPMFVPGDVELAAPVPGYTIGSPFGMRHHPILGIDRLHAGGDIGAPSGTPIYAPADGIVVFAGDRGGYGNAVVIDHGHSLGTMYGHQSRLAVATGAVLKRGDLIGYVGSTGLSTGPHLHFETRVKGVPIDPQPLVDWSVDPRDPNAFATTTTEN